MRKGLVHIYFGDGKGKTSAALGLALRALGCGRSVCVAQFLKISPSGEVDALARFERARVLRADEADSRFVWQMSDFERAKYFERQRALFWRAISLDADVLVLDEVLSAIQLGALPEDRLVAFLAKRDPAVEVVLTGRDPSPAVCNMGDYITRMEKIAHPFDRGQMARGGIEY